MGFENWENKNLTEKDGTVHTRIERWGEQYPSCARTGIFEDGWTEARKDPETRALYYKNLLYNQSELHRRVLELEEQLGIGHKDWEKFIRELGN